MFGLLGNTINMFGLGNKKKSKFTKKRRRGDGKTEVYDSDLMKWLLLTELLNEDYKDADNLPLDSGSGSDSLGSSTNDSAGYFDSGGGTFSGDSSNSGGGE